MSFLDLGVQVSNFAKFAKLWRVQPVVPPVGCVHVVTGGIAAEAERLVDGDDQQGPFVEAGDILQEQAGGLRDRLRG
jgi:hypothetical protein